MAEVTIIQSDTFASWLANLRDRSARSRILKRLVRLAAGNAGDTRPVGGGISELRLDTGPGYRVYYLKRGPVLIVVLAGGDKSSQQADIARAGQIAREWEESNG